MKSRTKILFLGFSVTEDAAGYVKYIRTTANSNTEICAIGVGGVQPNHAKYIFPDLIQAEEPCIVVLEIGTAGFRKWLHPKKYLESLLSLIATICNNNAMPVILDLPRLGIDIGDDWVRNINIKTAKEINFPYIDLAHEVMAKGMSASALLRDEVHNNDYGAKFYADCLNRAIPDWKHYQANEYNQSAVRKKLGDFEVAKSISILKLITTDGSSQSFERGGYKADVFLLPAEQKVSAHNIGNYSFFSGLTFLMDPLSGAVSLSSLDEARQVTILCFDQHSYYQRLGAIELTPFKCNHITFTQTSEQPTIELIKGQKDLGQRIGKLGSLFFLDKYKLDALHESSLFKQLAI